METAKFDPEAFKTETARLRDTQAGGSIAVRFGAFRLRRTSSMIRKSV